MKKLVTIAFISVLMSGCATVIDGTTQEVKFESNPKGVEVYNYHNELMGVTPFTLKLKRDGLKHYVAKKSGYKTMMVSIPYSHNTTTHANAVMPGFYNFTSAVDNLTGANLELAKQVDIKMVKE